MPLHCFLQGQRIEVIEDLCVFAPLTGKGVCSYPFIFIKELTLNRFSLFIISQVFDSALQHEKCVQLISIENELGSILFRKKWEIGSVKLRQLINYISLGFK